MHHLSLTLPRLLAIVFTVLLFGTGEAQAKKGIPKLYTFGPANSEVGPIKKEALEKLPQEDRTQLKLINADTVGFNYKHFGLFWLDIWSWGARYTVYNKLNEVPYVVSDAQAAALLGIKESELSKPLSYHIPWGLVLILGLVSLKFVPRILASRRARRQQVPDFMPPAPTGAPPQPRWTPQSPPPGAPGAGGPPPMPPPMPPDQH